MRRVILTWDSDGNWTPPNVRASHEAAAKRWGAEYVVNTRLTCSPFADKALMLRDAQGDQVAWLDGDAIVRYDCPNLFDIVPRDTFAGAPNYQGDTHAGDPWYYHESDWQWMVGQTGRMDIMYDPARFINGGVLVFSPEHHRAIWECDYPAQPNAEQTMMNFRADMLGVKRLSLAPTFNRIGPDAWQPGPMTHFVQHLAVFRWGDVRSPNRNARRPILEAIDWTRSAVLEAVA